jgi:hypothetical protein
MRLFHPSERLVAVGATPQADWVCLTVHLELSYIPDCCTAGSNTVWDRPQIFDPRQRRQVRFPVQTGCGWNQAAQNASACAQGQRHLQMTEGNAKGYAFWAVSGVNVWIIYSF